MSKMKHPPKYGHKYGRFAYLKRLLFVLACMQVFAPTTAAIADALNLDRRQAVSHIEGERSPGCVVVHPHDCILCSIATTPMARPVVRTSVTELRNETFTETTALVSSCAQLPRPQAPSRAPPLLRS